MWCPINAGAQAALSVKGVLQIALLLEFFWDLAELESHAFWISEQDLKLHVLDIWRTEMSVGC